MNQLLTIKDLSGMLQLKVSTLYSLVYSKKIPYKKVGTGKTSSRNRISSIDSLIQDAVSDAALVEKRIPGSYRRWESLLNR